MTKTLTRLATLLLAPLAMLHADDAPSPKKPFGAEHADARPNIVMIFCDDLTTQAISAYGDDRHLLSTPGMDRLAKEGMRFDRCLVPNPLCSPSRAVLLTGKYSHLNGVYNNKNRRSFDGSQQTFPKLLQQAGYKTALVGKWHLYSEPTGFDYWNILPGQGLYYDPPMVENGKAVFPRGHVTDITTDVALDWVQKRDQSKPFMLMVQHKAPHRDWQPALRHLNFDHDRVYPEPPTLFDDFKGRSKALQDADMTIRGTLRDVDLKLEPFPPLGEQRYDIEYLEAGDVYGLDLAPEQLRAWNEYYEPRNRKYREQEPTGDDLVRWRYQRYMHDYLACVKGVDDSVAQILKYLDDSGLSENTVVVLSSDQGFFLGEHGWFDKRWIFQESVSTPFLLRWPGVVRPGQVCDEIVSLLDVAETFLDIAGQGAPDDMQGHSLVPLLTGQNPQDWRSSFYFHYYEYPEPHRVRPHYGVITKRFTLAHIYGPDVSEWELMDREVDPRETVNFYNDTKYQQVVTDLKEELARLQSQFGDHVPPARSTHGSAPFEHEQSPKSEPSVVPNARGTDRQIKERKEP